MHIALSNNKGRRIRSSNGGKIWRALYSYMSDQITGSCPPIYYYYIVCEEPLRHDALMETSECRTLVITWMKSERMLSIVLWHDDDLPHHSPIVFVIGSPQNANFNWEITSERGESPFLKWNCIVHGYMSTHILRHISRRPTTKEQLNALQNEFSQSYIARVVMQMQDFIFKYRIKNLHFGYNI